MQLLTSTLHLAVSSLRPLTSHQYASPSGQGYIFRDWARGPLGGPSGKNILRFRRWVHSLYFALETTTRIGLNWLFWSIVGRGSSRDRHSTGRLDLFCFENDHQNWFKCVILVNPREGPTGGEGGVRATRARGSHCTHQSCEGSRRSHYLF